MLFFAVATALLTGSIGDFKLHNGVVIPDCKITYRVFGTMNADRSNVVLIPTWFNGVSEDWARFIGPGGLVDSTKYYVIVADALANGNSSSPSNHPTLKAQHFPTITIQDMVESHYLLLTQVLKINHVRAVMGVSMGGMQTFQWLVWHPDFMDKGISIVGTPHMSAKDVELWSKAFNIGGTKKDAEAEAAKPAQDNVGKWLGMLSQAAGMYSKYKQPFNALRQFEALAAHDVSKGTNQTIDGTAQMIKAKVMVIVATQDQAVSPELPLHYAELLKAPVIKLEGPCGHKAYDCEQDKIAGPINAFLDAPVGGAAVQAAPGRTGDQSDRRGRIR